MLRGRQQRGAAGSRQPAFHTFHTFHTQHALRSLAGRPCGRSAWLALSQASSAACKGRPRPACFPPPMMTPLPRMHVCMGSLSPSASPSRRQFRFHPARKSVCMHAHMPTCMHVCAHMCADGACSLLQARRAPLPLPLRKGTFRCRGWLARWLAGRWAGERPRLSCWPAGCTRVGGFQQLPAQGGRRPPPLPGLAEDMSEGWLSSSPPYQVEWDVQGER